MGRAVTAAEVGLPDPSFLVMPAKEAVRKSGQSLVGLLFRRSRESGNPGISVTCPGPPLSRGRRLEKAANLVTPAKAGIRGAILRARPPLQARDRLWTPAFRGSDDSGDMRLRRSLIYATWY